MVNVTPAGTDYPRTDKGTAIRAAFYRTLDTQIEATYETAEVFSGELCLSEAELQQYIREELAKVLSPSAAQVLGDDTDFFSIVVDSLQTIRLRNVLAKNFRTNSDKLSSKIVFEFPTIASLARELHRLRTGGSACLISTAEKMEELISRYSAFEAYVPLENSREGHNIVVTGTTISLCLKARRPEPATFSSFSSVSAVARTNGGFVPEALPESLDYARNMGYTQSKLVTENIFVTATKCYGIKTQVLRVGQVIADSVHGVWNAIEAILIMLQAGLTINAIPKLDERPLRLPFDVVASAIADISISAAAAGMMNIVNHRSFHWTRDLLPALHQAGMDVAEMEPSEWVITLRKSNPDPVANSPIKLVEFFASKYENSVPRAGLTYDTSNARSLSPSIAAAPLPNNEMVLRLITRFKETSWETAAASVPAPRLIVATGGCGSSKCSIARAIPLAYGTLFLEGDQLHSKDLVEKMEDRVSLSDEKQWSRLKSIKATTLGP